MEDKFDYVGGKNSYILENKIAFKRGIPPEKRRLIYREVDRIITAKNTAKSMEAIVMRLLLLFLQIFRHASLKYILF